jgi:hypothetical protein
MGREALLDDAAQVAALEARLEDEDVVLLALGQVVGQDIYLVGEGVHVLRVGRGVLAVVHNRIDEVLSEDDGLDLPLERLLEDVVLGEVDGFVGVVGGGEFWLGGQEDIVRDAA